ncbi:hypothetical protein Lser_V15G06666 [Lactuca serriola]
MMKSEALTIDDLVGFLLQEEARLEQEHYRLTSVTLTYVVALNVSRSNHRQTTPHHGANSSSSNSTQNFDCRKKRPVCQLCTKPSHEAINYWQQGIRLISHHEDQI